MRSKTFSRLGLQLLATIVSLTLLPQCLLQAQQGKLSAEPQQQFVIKRGNTAVATLRILIPAGLHVNSDKPKDEFLIPFHLSWEPSPLKVTLLTYPAPETTEVGSDKLSVFTGAFAVKTEFAAAIDARPGPTVVTGKLHYQACNDRMCFRPLTLEIRQPVLIE